MLVGHGFSDCSPQKPKATRTLQLAGLANFGDVQLYFFTCTRDPSVVLRTI